MKSNGRLGLGLLFVISLLGVAALSAPGASAIPGCTDNPDGTHTCTSSIPNPPGVPCPTTFNGTTSISPGLVLFIPAGSVIQSHQLILQCPGSTVTENFDPNASSPPPSSGDQTVRDDFTVTCNQGGGCAGGHQAATLEVTYSDLFGVATGPKAPPSPTDVKFDPKAEVKDFRDWTIGTENLTGYDEGLTLLAIYLEKGFSKNRSADAAAKQVPAGTLNDTMIPAGKSVTVTGRLNGRGRRALLAAGKLRVILRGTLTNSVGSTPFSAKLKLVLSKSKH